LKLGTPLSSCAFTHHLLFELQQHSVVYDNYVTTALNSSCTLQESLVLDGDSVCVRAVDAAAAQHMATAWHDLILHLQVVSGVHVSQEHDEAMQLKLQMQARNTLCADEVQCDITCLSCDSVFIASTLTRIAIAKFPLDKAVGAFPLSHVSAVDTLTDGTVRLFFVPDAFPDTHEPYVSLGTYF
jgi:hypothetical protein